MVGWCSMGTFNDPCLSMLGICKSLATPQLGDPTPEKFGYTPGAATRGNADAPWYWNWHTGGAEASQYLRMTQWHSIKYVYIAYWDSILYIFHVYPLNSFVIAFAVFLLLSERKSAVDQNLDDRCLVKSHLVSGSSFYESIESMDCEMSRMFPEVSEIYMA